MVYRQRTLSGSTEPAGRFPRHRLSKESGVHTLLPWSATLPTRTLPEALGQSRDFTFLASIATAQQRIASVGIGSHVELRQRPLFGRQYGDNSLSPI